jgi:RNA polymerase sigma-70 factor (ECF subfamily)
MDLTHLLQADADIKIWLFSIYQNLHNEVMKNDVVPFEPHYQRGEQDRQNTPRYKVSSLLAGLPADQKQAFLLVSLEGLAYEDVCRILNIPLGALLARLHSARQWIGEQLRRAGQQTGVERAL